MTELDFDELDKAVNSLMGEVEDTSTAQGVPAAGVPSATAPGSSPRDTKVLEIPSTEEPETKSTPAVAPLAAKRRGQFMDVMHSSSNMKSSSLPLKRQGVTVVPVSGTEVAKPTDDESEVTDESETPSVDVNPVPVESQPDVEPTTEWPDPIDLLETNEKGDEPAISDISDVDEPQNESAPLESPFLADAKPEKRPLGAPQAPANDETTADADGSDDNDVSLETPPQPAPIVLPAELDENIIAIEADTTITDAIAPVEEQPEPVEVEPTPTPTPAPEVKPEEQKPAEPAVGSGNIPQQYKEEPSTGDQTNGSIYDTANYHKAIEAHASSSKKGAVLKWVIWVLLLLIIGIGAGATYFMMTR